MDTTHNPLEELAAVFQTARPGAGRAENTFYCEAAPDFDYESALAGLPGALIYANESDETAVKLYIHYPPAPALEPGRAVCPVCAGTGTTGRQCKKCGGETGNDECLCHGMGVEPCPVCDGWKTVNAARLEAPALMRPAILPGGQLMPDTDVITVFPNRLKQFLTGETLVVVRSMTPGEIITLNALTSPIMKPVTVMACQSPDNPRRKWYTIASLKDWHKAV